MDGVIQISKLNDFIFCPYSIYLHGIYDSFRSEMYHDTPQTIGKLAHNPIDNQDYSSRKTILQGLPIYSERYGLVGKIDIYDTKTKSLIERKYKITKIYDGYRYQLYAQYFGMREAGYEIKYLYVHSLADNKRYPISLPNSEDIKQFESLIILINQFKPSKPFTQNHKKCAHCIYRPLCSFASC